MNRALPRWVAGVLALIMIQAQAGCVTAKKYRLAKDDAPPARPIGWTTTAAGVELTLETLVVFKGPGSWKKEARWDEYEVRVANPTEQPLKIENAALTDLLGNPQAAGVDPWQLEKASYTNWDKYGKTGLKLLAGAGAVVVYAGFATSVALTGIMGGAAASGGAVALASAIPIVAAVDVTAVAVMNHQNRMKVEAEFDRRRLKLPLIVAPGTAVAGSLFFPMTPGPQRLVLKARVGDVAQDIVLDLKPLAGLHLAPAKAK